MNKIEKIISTIVFVAIAALLAFTAMYTYVSAATEEEIDTAIADGITWLVAQQTGDGSWPESYADDVATTGLAVLMLEHHAHQLGYDSPFHPHYAYQQNVTNGLVYLFSLLLVVDISPQDHTAGATGTIDDPDSNGNGKGVYADGYYNTYGTAIALSAISVSGTPNRVVDLPGSPVNGWAYKAVAQDMVDWLAWAQSDGHYDYGGGILCGEGGWSYTTIDNSNHYQDYSPDNSNSGYAVSGLAYAEEDFGCIVPPWVKTELNAYISCIQDPVDGDDNDGGSWYEYLGDSIGVNTLKTGNLIFEMALVGDMPTTPRAVEALDYLARHWDDASGPNQPPGWDGDPAHYQAMFTTMKGLEYMNVDGFNGIDWYSDFSDRIVAQQYKVPGSDYGSWQSTSGRGNPIIITEWALITLEMAAPPVNPLNFSKDDGLTDGECCVNVGANITYALCYDNTENTFDVHNLTIVDTLPVEIDFVSASDSGNYDSNNHTVTWEIGTLQAGATQQCVQLVVELDPATTPGSIITNSATIDSDEISPITQNKHTEYCIDSDDDGRDDCKDNCPQTPNGPDGGTCSEGSNSSDPCTIAGDNEIECGTGGFCSKDQEDGDEDTIGDVCDNCPYDLNPDQEDADDDGIGDACDDCADTDDDGYGDPGFPNNTCDEDNCPYHYNPDQADTDEDDLGDVCDNCPETPNGPNLGTCVSFNDGSIGGTCMGDGECGAGEFCSISQEDRDLDGLGDACDSCTECRGDFDLDRDVDGTDAFKLKQDFGRQDCSELNPCNGDFGSDGDVDGTDAFTFKKNFGRRDCPECPFSCY